VRRRLSTRKGISVLLLFFLGMVGARNASGAPSVEDQVKILAQRYKQVEDQLARSIHYLKKTESNGATTIEQAWFNGADDLIKVAVERIDSSGRRLAEYFAPDFENDAVLLILTRKETAQPDGMTQVDEWRQYYDGELIRELKKSARVKAGESLDTAHVPDVIVEIPKRKEILAEEDREPWRGLINKTPQEIADALKKAGPPDFDPFANVKGDSEKFRLIQGTASPDGRYAVALGFTKENIDWKQLEDLDHPGTYSADDYDCEEIDKSEPPNPDYGKIRNYVVDLTTRRILGETGCCYFGTKRNYNYRACGVSWSPDSKNFVQLTSAKWFYVSCRAGRITPGPKLLGNVDVGKYAEKNASSYLKKHKHGNYEGSIDIGIDDVTDGGMISLKIIGQEASGERKGDLNFSVAEKIRMRETPAGLRLETVGVRNAPQE
jgi:hypothetical protein